MRCPHCDQDSPPGFRFCGHCGRPFSEPEPAPAGRGAAIAPAAGPSGGAAERRQVTVVFCDLVGSTAVAQRLDPEELRELVREVQGVCAGRIERLGGHVAQYLGDGVLAYFGYPTAHEDDAERAVRAGLAIVAGVAELGERWSRERGIPVAARIGIHTGSVVAGEVGAGAARERLAVGEVPNVAARIQGEAAPGTVVVSGATRDLLGGLFELADLGPRELKGVTTPVEVFRVVAAAEAASRIEAAASRGAIAPLIGREGELALLRRAFDHVRGGRSRAVLLVGEPGVGKSRLMYRFAELLATEVHRWWLCRSSPLGRHSAFDAILGWLQRLAELRRDDSSQTRWRRLEAATSALGVDGEAATLLAALLGIPSPPAPPPPRAAPQRLKEETLEALLAILRRAAARGPVVFVVEDVHWLDPSTRELVEQLLEAPPERLLLVLVARPEGDLGWIEEHQPLRLGLDRLSEDETRRLVDEIRRGRELPPEVTAEVVEKTDGIPLFVEELTRMVLESDLAAESGAEAGERRRPLAIPATLQGSLQARLDRLGTAKEVAQLGAVVGRTFQFEVMVELTGLAPGALAEALDRLVEADLLLQQGEPPRATYWFRHALIQDAAYDSLLRSRRREVHGRLADLLESRFPREVAGQPEVLARHLADAGRAQQAAALYLEAGRRAFGSWANVEALGHFQRGVVLIGEVPPESERDRLELDLQSGLCVALNLTRGFATPEAEAAYRRSRDLCAALGDEERLFWVLHGLWNTYFVGARLGSAAEQAAAIASVAQRRHDLTLLAQAEYAVGVTAYFRGELTAAEERLRTAIALDEPDRDRRELQQAGLDVGVIARSLAACLEWLRGRPAAALALAEEAVELATRLAHPWSLAVALLHLAQVRFLRGEAAAAREVASRLLALPAEHQAGLAPLAGLLLGCLDGVGSGEASSAAELDPRRCLTLYRTPGARLSQTCYLAFIAATALRHDDLGAAGVALQEGLELVETTGERFWLAELLRLRAELARRRDDPAGAAADLGRALAVARAQGAVALTELVERDLESLRRRRA